MNKTNEHQCVFVPRLDGWEYCECGNKVQVYDPVQGKHIDERIETIHNAYGDLREKYLKLVEYVKWISFYPNYLNLGEEEAGVKAEKLLKEIGEL